jgi:hypothetical protein
MTMLTHLPTFADGTASARPQAAPGFAVTLFDRRKGRPHRIAGIPLTLMTADPDTASADLLRNRDPGLWGVIVEERDRKGRIQ